MTLEVGNTTVTDLDYTYANGRLTGLESSAGVSPAILSYSYLSNSNLVATLVANNGTSDVLSTARTYDNADRLLSICLLYTSPSPRDS